MNKLERIVQLGLKSGWDIIIQNLEHDYKLIQVQYNNNDETWVRGYLLAPDSTQTSIQIANSIFTIMETRSDKYAHRHYILITPDYIKHKTYFLKDSLPPGTSRIEEKIEEEPLEGVYFPPKR